MEMLAIIGIILVTMFISYFMGYAHGGKEQKESHQAGGVSCSCGAVNMHIKGLTPRNRRKIGLVTGNTYHQIPPYVCHPVHDAVLGSD